MLYRKALITLLKKLERAVTYHKGLKDGSIERSHSYSLQYATKDVKELKKKS